MDKPTQQAPSTPVHSGIHLFEFHARLLDLQGKLRGLDDAIIELVAWMDLARDRLTEGDLVVLGEIGGMIYREGLRRRGAPECK